MQVKLLRVLQEKVEAAPVPELWTCGLLLHRIAILKP
jgi:hypothetical protein